jgi:ribosomal protein S18 acetylase RimI-like enzyme
VTIRPARAGDAAAIAALWREVDALHARVAPGFFRETIGDSHALTAVRRALAQAGTGRDRAVLVAELDGEVVGFVDLAVYETPPSPERRPRRRGHVDELVVAPARRRRGIGRALMAAAAEWARGRDAEQLLLTVWEGNGEAEGLYRALGYAPVSRVLGIDLR